MDAFISYQTCDLVSTFSGLPLISCRWVFSVKHRLDGTVDEYKARLVSRGFTQNFDVDYLETFSPVARLNSVHVLFYLAVNKQWPMF